MNKRLFGIELTETNLITRLKLCYKILRTKGYLGKYTIQELIEDDF